jgi:hypothetical protein
MLLVNVKNVSVHFTLKIGKNTAIFYEKLCMKLYLSDEKIHVDPCPHNGILLGLKDYWAILNFLFIYVKKL